MKQSLTIQPATHHEEESYDKTVLGFWLYIMTDCLLFASLFAAYAVLHNNTFGGPTSRDIIDLPYVLLETLILLTSSFTSGLAILAFRFKKQTQSLVFWGMTFLLGLSFLGLEIHEFTQLVQEGHSWTRSAFLSSYFTLVGTHGFHITMGLLWMLILMCETWMHGLNFTLFKRFMCLSFFWHFLDIVWIFIFTIVYLMGVFT